MKDYFEDLGRIDPFDLLGLPSTLPRPGRWRIRRMLAAFETTIDEIIARRRRRLAENPDRVPNDILTLLLRARDPQSGEGLSEIELRSNVLTFIAAGHETTANSVVWSLYLLSQSPEWQARVRVEAARELDRDANGLTDRLVETRAVIDEA